MSRYILLPSKLKDSFVLVSIEDLNQTHTIELPEELYDMTIFENVHNRNRANNLLYQIGRSDISNRFMMQEWNDGSVRRLCRTPTLGNSDFGYTLY